jgi:hypothetical protein
LRKSTLLRTRQWIDAFRPYAEQLAELEAAVGSAAFTYTLADPPFINPVAAVPVKKTRTNGKSVLVVFGGISAEGNKKSRK